MSTPTPPTPPVSPPPSSTPQYGQTSPGGPYAEQPAAGQQQFTGYTSMPGIPQYAAYAGPTGQLGRMRPTGMTILLFFVTFGIWAFIYYFQTHEEMKRHSGEGLGGVLALVISLFFGIVSPFLLSHEVGQLYERRGRQKPVSAVTALWFFPGILILVGPFIWFVRTNNALNDYWRGLGVRETSLV